MQIILPCVNIYYVNKTCLLHKSAYAQLKRFPFCFNGDSLYIWHMLDVGFCFGWWTNQRGEPPNEKNCEGCDPQLITSNHKTLYYTMTLKVNWIS
jgi:hypothetical protein